MSSLRSPGSAHWRAQGLRFALVGAFIMVLYVTVTTVVRTVFGAPWPVAVGAGYVIATSTHFLLHRTVVFRSEEGFALSAGQQLPRFVAIVVCQYLVTVAGMAVLPEALGLPSLVVYLGVACTVTAVSFLILRTRLFHPAAR